MEPLPVIGSMQGLPLAPSPRHISNSSLSHKTQSLILFFAVWILRSPYDLLLGEVKFWHRGVFYHYSLIIFIMVFLVIVFDGFYIWLMAKKKLVLVLVLEIVCALLFMPCLYVCLCMFMCVYERVWVCAFVCFVYVSVCVRLMFVLVLLVFGFLIIYIFPRI